MHMPVATIITPEEFLTKVKETNDTEEWHIRMSRNDVYPITLYLVDKEGEIKAFSADLVNSPTAEFMAFFPRLDQIFIEKRGLSKGTWEVSLCVASWCSSRAFRYSSASQELLSACSSYEMI
jgi:hypothetical protein